MQQLRSPDGCPWDREQTSESLKPYLIEETYEVLEAIDRGDPAALKEELGDLLLQIVFHARIGEEQSEFSMDEVVDTLCAKLIHRHPHVFGDVTVQNADDVLRNWEKIKQTEGNRKATKKNPVLNGIPKHLPALLRAQRVQEKVSRIGFDWPDWRGAAEKVYEELEEVQHAIKSQAGQNIEEELGDLLFSCVNLVRNLDYDAENALNKAVAKFTKRFEQLEHYCAEQDIDLQSLSLEEMDRQWEIIKANEPDRDP